MSWGQDMGEALGERASSNDSPEQCAASWWLVEVGSVALQPAEGWACLGPGTTCAWRALLLSLQGSPRLGGGSGHARVCAQVAQDPHGCQGIEL